MNSIMKEYVKKSDILDILATVKPDMYTDAVTDLKGVFMNEADACTITEEDLSVVKESLRKIGYRVVKRTLPMPTLRPCICGCKKTTYTLHIDEIGDVGRLYVCPRCNLKSLSAKTERAARKNWNKMIEEKLSEREN